MTRLSLSEQDGSMWEAYDSSLLSYNYCFHCCYLLCYFR